MDFLSPRQDPRIPPGDLLAEPELLPRKSLAALLLREPYRWNFFQAVRLLERFAPARAPVGYDAHPRTESVQLRAHLSLSFPPSQLYQLEKFRDQPPELTLNFMGLTGPSGILPRHYTELLLKIQKEEKGAEKDALRDFLALFDHRLISHFYRSWAKYRFWVPYERAEYAAKEPDLFTQALASFIGLGMPSLRKRLRVSFWDVEQPEQPERVLARVDDRALLFYSGLLSQRPRSATGLQALLEDYFRLPVAIKQFQGQWLQLEPTSRTYLGSSNCGLGSEALLGERVWDVVNRFRVRLGPLRYSDFVELMPDRAPVQRGKAFFLLVHLVRLYIGPDMTFDVQLVLAAPEIPECQLSESEDNVGPRLGWNMWLRSQEAEHEAQDAAFEGEEVVWVNR